MYSVGPKDNHSSFYICLAVGLSSASPDSILLNIFRAPGETWSGIVNPPFTIFFYRSLSLVPLNGKHPFSIAYNNTPLA